MPFDRMPHHEFGPLIERFRLLEKRSGLGDTTLELTADCHFGIGFLVWEAGFRVILGGPNTRPYRVRPDEDVRHFFVRFRPGKLPRLADVRPSELLDTVIEPGPRLFGVDLDSLCERIHAAKGFTEQQELLESLLRSHLGKPLCQDRRCIRALEMIESMEGRIQVTDVAESLGMSPRSLRRMFVEQVGMPPKQFICHLRFQKILQRIHHAGPSVNLGRLAWASGYSDQSHLIRDFRTLTGRLPSDYLPHGNALRVAPPRPTQVQDAPDLDSRAGGILADLSNPGGPDSNRLEGEGERQGPPVIRAVSRE